jgi:hypothetical protein
MDGGAARSFSGAFQQNLLRVAATEVEMSGRERRIFQSGSDRGIG